MSRKLFLDKVSPHPGKRSPSRLTHHLRTEHIPSSPTLVRRWTYNGGRNHWPSTPFLQTRLRPCQWKRMQMCSVTFCIARALWFSLKLVYSILLENIGRHQKASEPVVATHNPVVWCQGIHCLSSCRVTPKTSFATATHCSSDTQSQPNVEFRAPLIHAIGVLTRVGVEEFQLHFLASPASSSSLNAKLKLQHMSGWGTCWQVTQLGSEKGDSSVACAALVPLLLLQQPDHLLHQQWWHNNSRLVGSFHHQHELLACQLFSSHALPWLQSPSAAASTARNTQWAVNWMVQLLVQHAGWRKLRSSIMLDVG